MGRHLGTYGALHVDRNVHSGTWQFDNNYGNKQPRPTYIITPQWLQQVHPQPRSRTSSLQLRYPASAEPSQKISKMIVLLPTTPPFKQPSRHFDRQEWQHHPNNTDKFEWLLQVHQRRRWRLRLCRGNEQWKLLRCEWCRRRDWSQQQNSFWLRWRRSRTYKERLFWCV